MYLQRNIFFGDDVQLKDLMPETKQFDLHGPQAGEVIRRAAPEAAVLEEFQGRAAIIARAEVYIVRRKPVSEQRWTIIAPAERAGEIWEALTDAGARPAGSLIYNVLRVRAGLPSVGRELSEQFIPLEVGLWDEVSFAKGCYTGQEIIARMESRNRLAKTIVMLQPESAVSVPATIYLEGRQVGQLTSSVTAPDGELFAIGIVKPDFAEVGQRLEIGDPRISAQVKALPEGSRREIR
jgi:folate-binding protein YgfZ